MWASSRQKCSQIRPIFSVHDELVYPNAYTKFGIPVSIMLL